MVQNNPKNFFLSYERPHFLLLCTLVLPLWLHWCVLESIVLCVKYKLKRMLKCLYIPLPKPHFCVRSDYLRQDMLWTSVRSELGTAPYYMASNSPMRVVFSRHCNRKCDWDEGYMGVLQIVLSASVLQCPALSTLLLLVVDATADWKKTIALPTSVVVLTSSMSLNLLHF